MFATKEVAEERQIKAAEQWRLAKRSMKRTTIGCMIPLILLALFVTYFAGYVAATVKRECVQRLEVTSTH